LEQYTASPRFLLAIRNDPQESQPNPTFKQRQGQSFTARRESGKNFIALVLNFSSSLMLVIPRISLISHVFIRKR
jgi:hypothetical protein